MDLPDGPLGDIDLGWYVGAARARILANRDFPHLDPKWLADSPLAQGLHARGLAPSPKWDGKKSPRGAKKDCPSFFWEWDRYDAFGVYTGPKTGVLVLDVDEPAKFRKWIGASAADLARSLVSYHRQDSPDAVRSGAARGKLIFKFAADDSHPLATVGKAALRSSLGVEVFYGHGDPAILGKHPDGPAHDYLLSDGPLGPLPDWLMADLAARARARRHPSRGPRRRRSRVGMGRLRILLRSRSMLRLRWRMRLPILNQPRWASVIARSGRPRVLWDPWSVLGLWIARKPRRS